MSRAAEVTIDWAEGEHLFRLRLSQIRELQEKCDKGPMRILRDLEGDGWRVDDLREVIRLGLIGGGMEPVKALRLVQSYVDDRPFAENIGIARAIVFAAVIGVPNQEETPGKPRAARRKRTPRA